MVTKDNKECAKCVQPSAEPSKYYPAHLASAQSIDFAIVHTARPTTINIYGYPASGDQLRSIMFSGGGRLFVLSLRVQQRCLRCLANIYVFVDCLFGRTEPTC